MEINESLVDFKKLDSVCICYKMPVAIVKCQ